MKWLNASSRWPKPAAGPRATLGRWWAERHCEPTGRREAPPDDRLCEAIQNFFTPIELDCFVADAPRNDGKPYFAFPARLSKNTPCSPNMFQNHQGRLTRSGRP